MKRLYIFVFLFFCFQAWGQNLDSEQSKLTPFFQALVNFSENIPHEKIYLHFDNTSYYQGDNIWFKCYIVTSAPNQLSTLSKTLYVELLNPGGELIDKRILKIENGECHGDFALNHLPFYSGFYEVRAYTKYLLNFSDDLVFSRMLPVFDKPKTEGNYEEKKMLKYGMYGPVGNFPMKRPRPKKEKAVNLHFFPEGGNPIQNIASRFAFEATDEIGNPIDITGIVIDKDKQELCQFASLHEGRGVFTYTPGIDKRKAVAEVEYSGKKYRFDMPEGLPQGMVMEVDNLSHPDSIGVILRRNIQTPAEILGVAVLNGGKMQNAYCVYTKNDETNFQIDKTQLLAGVSQIVLFNSKGEILCDRLIFTGKNDCLEIKEKTGKPTYKPYELVEMELSIADKDLNPVNTTFSLSVRDRGNEVESKHNILTDLLLMSEIKGYVHDPFYYFERDDDTHRSALDLLLMVQGWRRYSWKQMAGIEPFELKHLAEQGIETNGKIVSFARQIPKPNVDVQLILYKLGEESEEGISLVESYVTDKEGSFSFVSDISGKWDMILTATEKGKRKDHRILLDRLFSPDPKKYRYADLQLNISGKNIENVTEEETDDELEDDDLESFLVAYQDSLTKTGITGKIHNLPEVMVKAKKKRNEQEIRYNRSTSIIYYDVASELDNIYDSGKYIGDDIHQMLIKMDNNFYIQRPIAPRSDRTKEFLCYEPEKIVLFIINYEVLDNIKNFFNYKEIKLSAIKSIYINNRVRDQYLKIPGMNQRIRDKIFSNRVVFIETYPEGQIPTESDKGVRKTWLEGYSQVKEFYSPDYSVLPLESDYRRTLYWNPSVVTGETGSVKVQFHNNSSCKNFSISAETITPQGIIGINKNR